MQIHISIDTAQLEPRDEAILNALATHGFPMPKADTVTAAPETNVVEFPPTQPPVAASSVPPSTPPTAGALPTAPPPTYTLDQLTTAAAPIIDQGRLPELQNLLAQFGVTLLTELPAEQYGAFATALRALGAAI